MSYYTLIIKTLYTMSQEISIIYEVNKYLIEITELSSDKKEDQSRTVSLGGD